uniref:target of rapamycin complex 2 subunit MAPKAP1 n=1 Tax=Ciona intestinalis TaxID=7719 RepID=UPI000180BA5A|nr:target of rapamycin complex 2 subunit MAPKAP1 [Ciona intestinalis]|eukprot:XP_002128354.1 target of rapamycin complex 2 subunit MAPKAP1 [Ciona intestinalis]
MAIVDDPDWLLNHIRHSFITSDDTGMCEMVIQENDLLTLAEHRKKLKEKASKNIKGNHSKCLNNTSCGVRGSLEKSPGAVSCNDGLFYKSSEEDIPVAPLAPSPDIQSGWDFGVRRRSNTAQKLEMIRKERQSRVQIKTVHWNQLPAHLINESKDSMFSKKVTTSLVPDNDIRGSNIVENRTDVKKVHINNGLDMQFSRVESNNVTVDTELTSTHVGFNVAETEAHSDLNESDDYNHEKKSHKRSVSALSQMLMQTVKVADNPFKEYYKFDGRGHEGATSTQRINMFVFVYGEPPPTEPMKVVMLVSGAKIIDLIGLSCWQYVTEKYSPPIKRTDVQGFTLNIAEDDGEVDYGFPALENNEPVAKFSFPTLALIEKHVVSNAGGVDGKYCESVFVKVNDYAGFSLIQVDDLNVTMGEILKKALKRRKGNNFVGKYNLEYQDRLGVCVDKDQTLDSTGAMEFCMVREHSSRSANNIPQEKVTRSKEKKVSSNKGLTGIQLQTIMSSS